MANTDYSDEEIGVSKTADHDPASSPKQTGPSSAKGAETAPDSGAAGPPKFRKRALKAEHMTVIAPPGQ